MCRYTNSGVISTKIDVYAFRVVLYELISARGAIIEYSENSIRTVGLDHGEESVGAVTLVAMVICCLVHFWDYKHCFMFQPLKYALQRVG